MSPEHASAPVPPVAGWSPLDELAAGVDLAGDLLLVELPLGTEDDERRRRVGPVSVLQRLLDRLQLGPVHPWNMVARGTRVGAHPSKED
jgi:hypothetical protein